MKSLWLEISWTSSVTVKSSEFAKGLIPIIYWQLKLLNIVVFRDIHQKCNKAWFPRNKVEFNGQGRFCLFSIKRFVYSDSVETILILAEEQRQKIKVTSDAFISLWVTNPRCDVKTSVGGLCLNHLACVCVSVWVRDKDKWREIFPG